MLHSLSASEFTDLRKIELISLQDLQVISNLQPSKFELFSNLNTFKTIYLGLAKYQLILLNVRGK